MRTHLVLIVFHYVITRWPSTQAAHLTPSIPSLVSPTEYHYSSLVLSPIFIFVYRQLTDLSQNIPRTLLGTMSVSPGQQSRYAEFNSMSHDASSRVLTAATYYGLNTEPASHTQASLPTSSMNGSPVTSELAFRLSPESRVRPGQVHDGVSINFYRLFGVFVVHFAN